MAQQQAQKLAHELFSKVQTIKLGDAAGIFGTTSRQSMLQSLIKASAELGAALAGKQPYETIMQKYEAVVANVDTAGITGLVSESELTDYYTLIDKLWAAIEKQKDAK